MFSRRKVKHSPHIYVTHGNKNIFDRSKNGKKVVELLIRSLSVQCGAESDGVIIRVSHPPHEHSGKKDPNCA